MPLVALVTRASSKDALRTASLLASVGNAFNWRYEMDLPVIAPNAPYVVYEEYQINDGDGNSNGMMDYGEEINLGLTVQNIGLVDADNVTATN